MSRDFEPDETSKIRENACPVCKSDLHQVMMLCDIGWRCVLCGWVADKITGEENAEE